MEGSDEIDRVTAQLRDVRLALEQVMQPDMPVMVFGSIRFGLVLAISLSIPTRGRLADGYRFLDRICRLDEIADDHDLFRSNLRSAKQFIQRTRWSELNSPRLRVFAAELARFSELAFSSAATQWAEQYGEHFAAGRYPNR